MRYIPVLLLLIHSLNAGICNGQAAYTALKNKRWSVTLSPGFGFLIAHRPSIVYLQQRHTRYGEAGFFCQTEGSSSWHADYSYPRYGVVYRFIDPGNRSRLGMAHAVMARVIFPLSPGGNDHWQAHFSYGMGYVEKPFSTSENYKNLAIGSGINGAISAGISYKRRLLENTDISAGADFMHFSNGSMRVPNLGANFSSIFMTLTRHFGPPTSIKAVQDPSADRKREWSFYAAGAFKEIYPPEGRHYSVAAVNAAYHLPISRKGLLGGGADAIIDNSLPVKIREENGSGGLMDGAFRFGIFASAGLSMGHWTGLFQIGGYLYNRYPKEGFIYNRLGLRYAVGSHLFFCMNLKSHYAKADYIEWGAGYRF